jgi:hypothetical protein
MVFLSYKVALNSTCEDGSLRVADMALPILLILSYSLLRVGTANFVGQIGIVGALEVGGSEFGAKSFRRIERPW